MEKEVKQKMHSSLKNFPGYNGKRVLSEFVLSLKFILR